MEAFYGLLLPFLGALLGGGVFFFSQTRRRQPHRGAVPPLPPARYARGRRDKHTPQNKKTTEIESKSAAARGVAAEPLGDHSRAYRRANLFLLSDFAFFFRGYSRFF